MMTFPAAFFAISRFESAMRVILGLSHDEEKCPDFPHDEHVRR